EEDEITRLGVGRRRDRGLLGPGHPGEGRARLGEDVLGEPGAVEARGTGPAEDVGGTDVLLGDGDDVTRAGGRGGRAGRGARRVRRGARVRRGRDAVARGPTLTVTARGVLEALRGLLPVLLLLGGLLPALMLVLLLLGGLLPALMLLRLLLGGLLLAALLRSLGPTLGLALGAHPQLVRVGPVGLATGSTSTSPKEADRVAVEPVASGAVTAAVAGFAARGALVVCFAGAAVSASAESAAWAGTAIAATRPPEAARTAVPLASGGPACVTIWPISETGL